MSNLARVVRSFSSESRLQRIARVVLLLSAALVGASTAIGQPQDVSAAPRRPLRERLLERAHKGEAEAQFDLAKNYEGGRIGLPQDLQQAAHWYREAANQGDPFAQASLAIFYNMGKGVRRDYVQSYVWLERSAQQLTGSDQQTVIEMRDSVGRKLSPHLIAEARRLAQQPLPASEPK